MGKLKTEGWTYIPNIILDEVMAGLSGAEMKCLLYIIRRTYGFRKERDRISLSQFQNGIINKQGDILDKGTGLAHRHILRVLKLLKGKGIIQVEKTTKGNIYKVGTKCPHFEDNISDNTPPSRDKMSPQVGTKCPIHPKGKESKEKRDEKDISSSSLLKGKDKINIKDNPKNDDNLIRKVLPLKEEVLKKGGASADFKLIEEHWIKEYKKAMGVEPIINYGMARKRFKQVLKVMSVDDIKEAMTIYINSERFKETPTINASLSEYSLNLAKTKSVNNKEKFY